MKPGQFSAADSANDKRPPFIGDNNRGFTLTELLVVIGTVAVLALTLLPVLARGRVEPQGTQCLSNLRQLTQAWLMYADDHNGNLVPNYIGDDPNGGLTKGWAYGGMSWPAGQWALYNNGLDNTNTYDLKNSLLGPYCSQRTDIYKCPSDTWQITGQPTINNGAPSDRVRSVSMNITVEGNAWQTVKAAVNFPQNESWWYGREESPPIGAFYAFNKESDYIHIGPANLFVFADEQADSINDGNQAGVGDLAANPSWGDMPAAYHNRSGSFSFADGHAALHRWVVGSTYIPVTEGPIPAALKFVGRNQVDYQWYISHTLVPYP